MRGLIVCLFLIAYVPGVAWPFDLNLKATARLEAEVGIDPQTRAFIERLPSEVRAQVVEAVRQSLTVLDVHVSDYLKQVDTVIANRINDLACKSTAATEMITTTIVEKFFSSRTSHVQDLLDDEKEIRDAFSFSDQPGVYRIKYADLYARSVVTYCRVVLAAPAADEVVRIQERLLPTWQAWMRLDGKCDDAERCLFWLRAETEKDVKAAFPWDAEQVKAKSRLDAVPEEIARSWWQTIRFWKHDPLAYESEFIRLFAIRDELRLTRELRQASALADIDEAAAMIAPAQQALSNARSHLAANRNKNEQDAAKTAAASAMKDKGVIAAKLTNAVAAWPEKKDRVDGMLSSFAGIEAAAQEVFSQADANLKKIEELRLLQKAVNDSLKRGGLFRF